MKHSSFIFAEVHEIDQHDSDANNSPIVILDIAGNRTRSVMGTRDRFRIKKTGALFHFAESGTIIAFSLHYQEGTMTQGYIAGFDTASEPARAGNSHRLFHCNT